MRSSMEPVSPNQTSIILAQANRRDSSVSAVRWLTISGADMDFAHAADGGTTSQTLQGRSKSFGGELTGVNSAPERAGRELFPCLAAAGEVGPPRWATLRWRRGGGRGCLERFFKGSTRQTF